MVECAGLTIVPMVGLTAVLMMLFNHLDLLGFLLANFVIFAIVGAGTFLGFIRWLDYRDAPRVNPRAETQATPPESP